jgi:hypothetical protein
MRAARPFDSWYRLGFGAPFNKNVLHCSPNVRDELMAALEFYSEIKTAGKELLRSNGHTNLAEAYLQFRAYIRQATTFYQAAEALHHRASPLNFYYSFMNLAKAVILLRTPNFVNHNLMHGISPQSKAGSLRKQKLSVKSNGVFPMFYKTIVGRPFSQNASLKIADLLGYVSDVQHEYVKLQYGPKRSFPCKYAIGSIKILRRLSQLLQSLAGRVPPLDK